MFSLLCGLKKFGTHFPFNTLFVNQLYKATSYFMILLTVNDILSFHELLSLINLCSNIYSKHNFEFLYDKI